MSPMQESRVTNHPLRSGAFAQRSVAWHIRNQTEAATIEMAPPKSKMVSV